MIKLLQSFVLIPFLKISKLKFIFTLLIGISLFTTLTAQSNVNVCINEVDADQPGSDRMEFVELYGPPNTSLDGLVVVFMNGSDDASYASYDLDGENLDANGFFIIGHAAVPGVSIVIASNDLQNGADAVALYQGDGTDFPNDTPVTMTNLIDALVYGTGDSDDSGLLTGLGQTTQYNDPSGNFSVSKSMDCGTTVVAQTPTPNASNNPSASADITFCVDATCLAANPTLAITGTSNAPALSDPDQDGIWCTTVTLAAGSHQYLFASGGVDEQLSTGSPCTVNTNGTNYRTITVASGQAQTVTYGYGTCDATCQTPPGADITFCVDATCLAANPSLSIVGMPNAQALSDPDQDGIWCTNVTLAAGPHQYLFASGGVTEQLSAGSPCTVNTSGTNYRTITVLSGQAQTVTFGYGSCDATCQTPPGADITFCVEASCLTSTPSLTVIGTSNVPALTDSDGDGTWCATVTLAADVHEFKFATGGVAEEFPSGSACTVNSNATNNRTITVVSGEAQTVTVGYGSCDATCQTPVVPMIINDASIDDPCACDLNGNGIASGTFIETVTVMSGLGTTENWSIFSITPLNPGGVAPVTDNGSGTPTSTAVATGTALTSVGGGKYEITFHHNQLDGFQLTARRDMDASTDLTISNVCVVPSVTSTLQSTYESSDATVILGSNIMVSNGGTAAAGFPMYTISDGTSSNGVTQLSFDPTTTNLPTGQLSIGTYTLTSTYETDEMGVGAGGTLAMPAIPTNACPVENVSSITVAVPAPIPTLSQWGLIILALLILITGMVLITAPQVATAQGQSVTFPISPKNMPFDRALFHKILPLIALLLIGGFSIAAAFFGYEWTSADPIGLLVTIPLMSYMVMLIVKAEEDKTSH